MLHPDPRPVSSGQERGPQRDCFNLSAVQVQLFSQHLKVEFVYDPVAGWRAWRKRLFPQGPPLLLSRRQKIDYEAQTAQKRRIQVVLAIGRKDRDAVELLDPLQQIINLDVRE